MLLHEQRMAKENLAIRKRQAAQDLRLAEMEAQRKWEADYASAKVTYPALSGRESEFRDFVLKPTHRTTPIDVLAKAFLMDNPPETPAAPPASPHGAINRGSAGPVAPSKKPKWTAEQVQQIQKTDSKRYREMLLAGEFDDLE